jgi:methyl-accepting chemotaxis protein
MNVFRKMTIGTRILMLPVLFVIGIALLQVANSLIADNINGKVVYPNFEEQVLNGSKALMKTAVEIQAITLGERVKDLKTREEQSEAIVAETDPIRFFEDNSGYFFTYDVEGIRINVPTNKGGNGKNFYNLQDQKGNYMVQDLIKAAKAGGGYVYYYFDKPGKGIQPKLSYVKMIPGTDIFVGMGVYIDNVEEERATLKAKIDTAIGDFTIYRIVLAVIIIGAIIAISLVIVRFITRYIKRVVDGLSEASSQVATAAGEVNTSSQAMAEVASQQAASLEETSASLDELSSMTKQNAENAREADSLTKNTGDIVQKANQSMGRLISSMRDINESSEEVAKIIKTIDDIAFQTNLLALNAAVEAARAGEAGAGFAVVADEVRNLAQRAAESARNTSSLIENTVGKIRTGSEEVGETSTAFNQVAESTTKLSSLVGEIAAASREQAQGIDQINQAITHMDQATQNNAATAEEAAASSEEMNSQAELLKSLVFELMALVGRGKSSRAATPMPSKPAIKDTQPRRKNEGAPKMIPMDKNFRDF